MISMHIDDFNLAGSEKFLESVTKEKKKVLDGSKVEDGKFRFTGIVKTRCRYSPKRYIFFLDFFVWYIFFLDFQI